MTYSIQLDTSELERSLGVFKSELPFGLAKGMNDTLMEIQREEISEAKDRFTIRREAFLKRSVKIVKFAKKTDLEGQIAIANVGTKPTADILAKFEDGTDKHAHQGRSIAVPTQFIQPVASRLVSRAKRPRQLKHTFKVQKGETGFLFQRTGRGRHRTVQLAYVLKPVVRIDTRLHFVDTATRVFTRTLETHINRRLEEAIASSKLR